MHVIKPQPVITFSSFSFAVSQRGRAAAGAASSSTGGKRRLGMKEEEQEEGWRIGRVPQASPEVSPSNARNDTSLAGA